METELRKIIEECRSLYEKIAEGNDSEVIALSEKMDKRITEYCEKNDLDWLEETKKVEAYLSETYCDDFWTLIVK